MLRKKSGTKFYLSIFDINLQLFYAKFRDLFTLLVDVLANAIVNHQQER